MSRRFLWIAGGIVLFLAFDIVLCGGVFSGSWLVATPLYLAFGWLFYVDRISREVQFSAEGFATAVVALIALTAGLHAFGRWWMRQRTATNSDVPGEPAEESRWPLRRSLAMVALVVLMFVAGLCGTAMVHQTTWLATSPEPLFYSGGMEAARRTQSKNNLKQIGLALHNYHDVFGHLAAGGTYDEAGRPLHSWQTFLLPYVEEQPLYAQIGFARAWNDPINAEAVATRISSYELPRAYEHRAVPESGEPAYSDYAANSHLFGSGPGVTFREVKDGLSNTLLAGEVNANVKAWADPTNVRDPTLGINASPEGFGSPFQGGANVLLGDGSVRFVSEEIDPQVLAALATPSAGDDPGDDW